MCSVVASWLAKRRTSATSLAAYVSRLWCVSSSQPHVAVAEASGDDALRRRAPASRRAHLERVVHARLASLDREAAETALPRGAARAAPRACLPRFGTRGGARLPAAARCASRADPRAGSPVARSAGTPPRAHIRRDDLLHRVIFSAPRLDRLLADPLEDQPAAAMTMRRSAIPRAEAGVSDDRSDADGARPEADHFVPLISDFSSGRILSRKREREVEPPRWAGSSEDETATRRDDVRAQPIVEFRAASSVAASAKKPYPPGVRGPHAPRSPTRRGGFRSAAASARTRRVTARRAVAGAR